MSRLWFVITLFLCSCGGGNSDVCAGTHQCEIEGTLCQDSVLQVCSVGADGCRSVTTITCGDGCESGESQCKGCGTDSCPGQGTTECTAGMLRTCAVDSVGCLSWSDYQPCQQGGCEDAATCMACQDECSAVGQTCSGDDLAICELGSEGCLVLAIHSCSHGCAVDMCSVCTGDDFAASGTAWSLPPGYQPFEFNVVASNSGANHVTMDMNGDGVLDLVVTGGDGTDPAAGDTHWNVYLGSSGGFASTPSTWTLPSGYQPFEFNVISSNSGANHVTMDVTGDKVPDLVVTGGDVTDASVGDSHWHIYVGSAGGFAQTPVVWSLPSGYQPFEFNVVASNSGANHATLDVSGDDIPDLVLTGDDATDPAVGNSRWAVYLGGPSGFAQTPLHWNLPSGYQTDEFNVIASNSGANHTTLDMNGDRIPDLVLTGDDVTDSTVGDSHWHVYLGSSSGFAQTPIPWSLPSGYQPFEFNVVSSNSGANHITMDMTGDGLVDLAITGDGGADANIGETYWSIYRSTGSGFAATPTTWALPIGYQAYEFNVISSNSGANHAAVDLDGDKIPDLVVTGDDITDASVGESHWNVYFGQCQ